MKTKKAFTLVEMLVSLTIMSMMSLLFVQIISSVESTWAKGRQLANNMGKGRLALDIISRDLQTGVFRPDLGAFAMQNGTPSPQSLNFCFFTSRSADSDRALSLVNYRLSSNAVLLRESMPVSWNNGSPLKITFGTNSIPQMATIATDGSATDLATGVLAFRMYFVNTRADGLGRTISLNYVNTSTLQTKAVGVAIVVVDEQTRKALESQSKLSALLAAGWEPPADLNRGLAKHWQAVLDNFLLSNPGLPSGIRSGVRVFECVVPVSVAAAD
ncbi:MAG: PilW family protein [Candidatus Methylacidiphilales bacterium]|nr:type II secretion system protein [Candidatus Methylacidiphilales bacterium]